ncbi:hypothetical protein GNZ01_07335 [Escherichia coli]|uniref:Uncharacterized protein n=1 Tax=Escherichia coli TaxID=562 RepID=A0AAJ3CWG5_ECOLX|nr:hypothetical protein [Escherichia coli]MUM71707.1 hypothetical protein [Escherichia coli]MUM83064.1 hypothetical protein [Escherichia coli]
MNMNPEIVQDLKKVIFLLNTRSSLYKEFKDNDGSFKPLCIEFNDLITDALFEFSEKYQDTVFGVKNVISPSTRKITLSHFTFDNNDLFSYNPSTSLYFIPKGEKNSPIHYGWIISYVVQGKEYPIKWHD